MVKSQIFLFSLLAFIAGVAIRSFLPVPYSVLLGVMFSGAVVMAVGILRKEKKIIIFGALILALLLGIFRFDQVGQTAPDLFLFYGKPLELGGVVVEEPDSSAQAQKLKIKAESIYGNKLESSFFVQVTARRFPEYKLGDELKIQGVLEKPENFGGFDYVTYLSRSDIFSAMSFPAIEKAAEGRGSKLKLILSKIKHSFEEKIDLVIPEPQAAFLKGLLLGERQSLPQNLVEDFKRTGTTHIVALSGYNITIVGRSLIAVLLFLTVPFRFSFWIASLAISLFVILTGASPSVVRAGIMGILVLVAEREGRMFSITNALVFAAAVMIFQNPKIFRFDAAFQLSFLSTLGLIYLSPRVQQKVEKVWDHIRARMRGQSEIDPRFQKNKTPENKTKRAAFFPFKQIFIETISAQLMVLPLLIYLFGRVSLVSPFSNILVLIAVPYAMAAGFFTGTLGFIWSPLSQILGWITWVLLEYQIRVIEFFAKFPGAALELPKWIAMILALLYIVLLFRLWRKSKIT